MSWDDWVFGILTGGAYNVAKGAYEGGKAVGDAVGAAGDAVEDIGKAVSTITSKATTLMDDMVDFIRELEEMVVIDRQVARTEDELWDEEVRRIGDIRAKEAALVAQLKTLGGNDDTASLQKYIYDGMISMVTGGGNAATKVLYQLALQILILRQAINEILYQEPGVIPEKGLQYQGGHRAFPYPRTAPHRGSDGQVRGYHPGDDRDPCRSQETFCHQKMGSQKYRQADRPGTG